MDVSVLAIFALFLFYDYEYLCSISRLTQGRPLNIMRTQNKKRTVEQKTHCGTKAVYVINREVTSFYLKIN